MERIKLAKKGVEEGLIKKDEDELKLIIVKLEEMKCNKHCMTKEQEKMMEQLKFGLKRQKKQVYFNGELMDAYVKGMARNTMSEIKEMVYESGHPVNEVMVAWDKMKKMAEEGRTLIKALEEKSPKKQSNAEE
ncbi:Oidioi.mRNA.OKI2018_I69.PAR.g13218.t1.cds [Oikopleura dioica]|uniref:Oidioi.mRNA.OKI2018_I69.PAR.g13218.t1.cds n=1 Tax=Oikopleura dioica TaxID=34765 RepID=A0ABN7S3U7_OIKDI|nr:Oidioi.mRNA.OKI2018_I69.PAR.g13218.t1.cds [Oikopleura dioica]